MYTILTKMASKNGWFTPAEAKNYYGRYDRHGITWHWWGDGTGASNHDNIVNYINSKAAKGTGSVNYVLSDDKITMSVAPDNVAWTSQSGNPVSVSVELQPTLNGEGYKKAGWLAAQLASRYGGDRKYYPHKYWVSTQCPGTISLDRIRQEEDKWQRGEYNAPAPAPAPTWNFVAKTGKARVTGTGGDGLWVLKSPQLSGQTVTVVNEGTMMDFIGYVTNGDSVNGNRKWWKNAYGNYFSSYYCPEYVVPAPTPEPVPTPPPAKPEPVVTPVEHVVMFTLDNAKLVNIKDMTVVKSFALNTPMDITGECSYNGNKFYLSKYAVDNDTKQGFLVGDLSEDGTKPEPIPPVLPEWEENLRDIDDTTYWVMEDCELIDITTGKPTGTKSFKKDEEFVGSAITKVGKVEYRITEYSYSQKIFNGIPADKLTLTPPGVPDVPPVTDPVDRGVVVAFLLKLVKMITDFIASITKK